MHYRKYTLVFLLFLALPGIAWSIDTPSSMLITGSLEASKSVSPSVGDKLLVLNATTGALVETGSVLSRQGLFSITMNKTSAFNGTPLTLQFQQGSSRYLLLEGEDPADFKFQGGLVPTRVSATLTISKRAGDAIGDSAGSGTGGAGDGGSGIPGSPNGGGSDDITNPAALTYDLNDDGRVDQLDIDIVKDVVAGRTSNDRADVNGDGMINTRDIIAIIKAVNRAERERRRELARQATTHP